MKGLLSVCRSALARAFNISLEALIYCRKTMMAVVWQLSPAQLVFAGYLFYVISGWILLCLPVSQKISQAGVLDHLFTAMSAVSTTGLTTVSTYDSYTFFGQLVVLALIQLGGIGYMTLGSFLILSRKHNLPPTRVKAAQTVFSLPASFNLNEFIKSVIFFTLAIELIGTTGLYFMFRQAEVSQPLWSAVFHSVSAFCTAGFSLYNNSFESFRGHFGLNLLIGALSYLGAIGFIVCIDFWNKWTGRTHSVTLTSKIVIAATFWLSIAGTLLLFICEDTIQALPANERLLASFFQTMTALTTVGFNTIGLADVSKASVLLLIIMMIIGASPSGTGGGIKVTTLSAMIGVIRSAIRGEQEVHFWGRHIPTERIWMAVASFGFYLFVLVIGVYLLDLSENTPFEKNFFEAASALGTVGLSMGITSGLTSLGKMIIIILMFIGRIGPISFGAALFLKKLDKSEPDVLDEDLAV